MKVLLILLLVAVSVTAAEKKPNFVLILADDLGYADVSFNGRKEWNTPNLHRLAQDGTVFRRWYNREEGIPVVQLGLLLPGCHAPAVVTDAVVRSDHQQCLGCRNIVEFSCQGTSEKCQKKRVIPKKSC